MSFSKLRGRIREIFGTQEAFAVAMDMSPGTLSCKLTGKTEWTKSEIEKACNLLEIPVENIHEYFF